MPMGAESRSRVKLPGEPDRTIVMLMRICRVNPKICLGGNALSDLRGCTYVKIYVHICIYI